MSASVTSNFKCKRSIEKNTVILNLARYLPADVDNHQVGKKTTVEFLRQYQVYNKERKLCSLECPSALICIIGRNDLLKFVT